MKTFSLALIAVLAAKGSLAVEPTIPPIYVPFASFYEHGQYVRSIIVSDKDGTVTWYPSLAKCRDAIFAQLEHAMGSAPEGGSINATCVPVPSMDLPRSKQ
jgi:hypothetical protein